ncbi:hypothetical protein FACS1894182_02390 [Bacteroidia bacterium]|nr:hypothetical protein FACS1894182_02390 [Bacteroidia bacterium]
MEANKIKTKGNLFWHGDFTEIRPDFDLLMEAPDTNTTSTTEPIIQPPITTTEPTQPPLQTAYNNISQDEIYKTIHKINEFKKESRKKINAKYIHYDETI